MTRFSILYRILGELPMNQNEARYPDYVSAFSIESWVSYINPPAHQRCICCFSILYRILGELHKMNDAQSK